MNPPRSSFQHGSGRQRCLPTRLCETTWRRVGQPISARRRGCRGRRGTKQAPGNKSLPNTAIRWLPACGRHGVRSRVKTQAHPLVGHHLIQITSVGILRNGTALILGLLSFCQWVPIMTVHGSLCTGASCIMVQPKACLLRGPIVIPQPSHSRRVAQSPTVQCT